MAGEQTYVRVPPDSSGKKLRHQPFLRLGYDTLVGNHIWREQSEYTTTGSKTMTVTIFKGDSTTAGYASFILNRVDTFNGTEPVVGDAINYLGVQVATITSVEYIHVSNNHIAGGRAPDNLVDVDNTGSMSIRFAEGLPQLDAWGKLRVNGATHLGRYFFSDVLELVSDFACTKIDGGYITHNSIRKAVRVGVDNNDPEINLVTGFGGITSNTYHHYISGSSHLYMGTARLNDPTATGTTREWGYFDDTNGFLFRINASGVFEAVIRSSETGSVVETIIEQANFNIDNVDATGRSQMLIDLSLDNIFWIDIQWHGAGRVRFGTFYNGQRVVMHEYYHGNNFSEAMTQTASLPVSIAVKSSGSTTSNLYVETWSASVWTEIDMDQDLLGRIRQYKHPEATITANVTDAYQWIATLAPQEIHTDGDPNHNLYMPVSIRAFAYDELVTNGVPAIIDLYIVRNPVHEGHTFTPIPASTMEVSTTGTDYGGGIAIFDNTFLGSYDNDLTHAFNTIQYGALTNAADDGGTIADSITAITNGSPAIITVDGELSAHGPHTNTFQQNISRFAGQYELTNMAGTTIPAMQRVYVKPTSVNTAELYTDADLTVPYDTTALGSYTSGGELRGFKGSRNTWAIYAKTRTALHTGPVKMSFSLSWKEIGQ